VVDRPLLAPSELAALHQIVVPDKTPKAGR
jgi:hypothetical protein